MTGTVGAAFIAPHATANLLLPEEKAKEIITEVSEEEIKFVSSPPPSDVPLSVLDTLDLSAPGTLAEITVGEALNPPFAQRSEIFKPSIGKFELQAYSAPGMVDLLERNRLHNINIDLGQYGRLMNVWIEDFEYHVAPGTVVMLDIAGKFEVKASYVDHKALHESNNYIQHAVY